MNALNRPTRQEFLEHKCSFQEYYGSIVQEVGIRIGDSLMEKVRNALSAGDDHLNSIPLEIWDSLTAGSSPFVVSAMKRRGDIWSKAGAVCVLKQAAIMQAEEKKGTA
jgi:hypothetical protein